MCPNRHLEPCQVLTPVTCKRKSPPARGGTRPCSAGRQGSPPGRQLADGVLETLFKQLGDGHHPSLAQGTMTNPSGRPGASPRRSARRGSPRRTIGEAHLRRVDNRHDADLGGRQRGDAEARLDLRARRRSSTFVTYLHAYAGHRAGDEIPAMIIQSIGDKNIGALSCS